MREKVGRYWAQFVESALAKTEPTLNYYDTFYFGNSAESAKLIAALVLGGIKTATGSLQWVYEADGKPIPLPGDYSVVTDGKGNPVCIIQDTEIEVIPFDQVDERFAWDGGEEDRTLTSWRRIYWEYIVSECARINREPTPSIPLVCERFRVVYKAPLKNVSCMP